MTARIEILGVAGSGKSTLARLLVSEYGYRLPLRPAFLRALPGLLLFLLRHWLPLFRFSAAGAFLQNLKLLIYCQAVIKSFSQQPESMVADQGVAFILGSLLRHDLARVPQAYRRELMTTLCEPYLSQLDAIVVVSVTRDTALERVNARSSDHRLKRMSAAEQADFLAYYEDYYSQLVSVAQQLSVPVLNVDSTATPASQLASEISEFVSRL